MHLPSPISSLHSWLSPNYLDQPGTRSSFWSALLPDAFMSTRDSSPGTNLSDSPYTTEPWIALNEWPGMALLINEDLDIVQFNDETLESTGYKRGEITGKSVLDYVILNQREQIAKQLLLILDGNEPEIAGPVRIYTKHGNSTAFRFRSRRIERMGKRMILACGYDIDRFQKKIRHVTRERDHHSTLLREIHHRVKNNLAIIAGLLQLQSFSTEDARIIEILQDSQIRIQSMALVHEKLYQSSTLANIQLSDYLGDLVDSIMLTLNRRTEQIKVELSADDITLEIEQAIPLGLMVNELVVNAIKYAFDDPSRGVISIDITHRHERVFVNIRDNGVGLPSHFSLDGQDSLGLTLIKTLIQQLDADLEFYNEGGAVFEIAFDRLTSTRNT